MVIPIIPVVTAVGTILTQVQQAQSQAAAAERIGKIRPGDILRAALDVQALSERGADPVVSTDPFTGDVVVSTRDQERNLMGILEDKAAREILAPFPEEITQIRELRDIVIDAGRRINTSDLRLQGQVSAVPVSTRATARLIAPGVVGRGNVPSTQATSLRQSRLSGPCAGPQTGFSRLRCAQGAFT